MVHFVLQIILIRVFKAIPFFKELAKQKLIVFLFDFDKEGFDNMCECLPKSKTSQDVYNIISKKDTFVERIDDDLKIFVTHLVPNNLHSWDIKELYRHQELKKEGDNGIKRQFDNLNKIMNL